MARAPSVSLAMVAARANVSIATASRVLNGVPNRASSETADRVRAAAAALDYRPAVAGQMLRGQPSRLVAVIAADLANPAMAAMAASIEHALRDRGLVMALGDNHPRADLQDAFLAEMSAHRVRAVLLIGAEASPGLNRIRAEGTPVVFVNRPAPDDAGAAYVGLDNDRAGADLARHLMERGHSRIGLVHAILDGTASGLRRKGLLRGLASGGIPRDAIVEAGVPLANHLEAGFQAMQALLARGDPPTVVACLTDTLAYGAHRALRQARDAPQVAFYGFDDAFLNDWVAPWLNSVAAPVDLYGPAVLEMLDRLGNGATTDLTLHLPHDITLRA